METTHPLDNPCCLLRHESTGRTIVSTHFAYSEQECAYLIIVFAGSLSFLKKLELPLPDSGLPNNEFPPGLGIELELLLCNRSFRGGDEPEDD